jgi:hypothetical protein
MITPHLTIKSIPFVCINHTYSSMDRFPVEIVGGGRGSYYGASEIWIIGRQQDKDGKDLLGYNFVINVEKSRSIREKSKIPISVSFEKGVHQWSGLFDIAQELRVITSEKQGWYNVSFLPSAFRRGDKEDDGQFWNEVFEKTNFKKLVRKRYKLHHEDSPTHVDGEVA